MSTSHRFGGRLGVSSSGGLMGLLLASCLVLSACHAAPRFSVTDVALTAESEDAYVLTFTLLGENGNADPLPLRRVHYALRLDGDRVFSGTRSAQATLPAHGSQTFALPVAVFVEGRGAGGGEDEGASEGSRAGVPWGQASDYKISGSVEYVLPGSISELLFDTRIRVPKAGFVESGTFEFTE